MSPSKNEKDKSHSHCSHDHSHNHSSHDDHSHSHGGHHHHIDVSQINSRFAWGIGLNLLFVFVEATYGFIGSSMALIADAGHNLTDVASLLIAWGALRISRLKPSERFTYGLKKSSIVAPLANSFLLLIAIGAILLEASKRVMNPIEPATSTMMIVASIGILINTGTALLFMKGSQKDINIRGAFIHMIGDAVISAGVVISGLLIHYTSWFWLDPVVSIVISLIILWSSWDLLAHSTKMILDGVPEGIVAKDVENLILAQAGVIRCHDLHIWPLSSTETAMTVHVVVKDLEQQDLLLKELTDRMLLEFQINHCTIQIESDKDQFICPLASESR